MAKIISFPAEVNNNSLTTADTLNDDQFLKDLKKQYAYQKKNHPDSEITKIVKNAVAHKKRNIKEHLERLAKYTKMVEEESIIGWTIHTVAIYEDKKVSGNYQWSNVEGVLYNSFDYIKGLINRFLQKNFKEYKRKLLTSSDDMFTGEYDEYGRFYMVNEYTDLGHNWDVPLIRYRLKDKGCFYEVYVTPIEQIIG